jgi:hypothetical protein
MGEKLIDSEVNGKKQFQKLMVSLSYVHMIVVSWSRFKMFIFCNFSEEFVICRYFLLHSGAIERVWTQ